MVQVPDSTHYAFVTPSAPPNREGDYPGRLAPVDDLPPVTVITHVRADGQGVTVRGTASDNGVVKRVVVNGHEAKALATTSRSGR